MTSIGAQPIAAVSYDPFFGATPDDGGAMFRVWAPTSRAVSVVIEGGDLKERPMNASGDGIFTASLSGAAAGTLYRYRLDQGPLLPDPASRYQPAGVDGPSMIVNPSQFDWTDGDWTGVRRPDLAIYELHVGTFTRGGRFTDVEARLGALRDLGVTAIELMPLAECAGRWNWGYDGVDLFAPSHHYGTPDDLRGLVDAAHAHGIGVIVDVVYNHFGPAGAHIHAFSPYFRTSRCDTPWGDGVNLDGEQHDLVRRFLIDNALHWVHEYHVDGLRLDAAHTLRDTNQTHFLAELADRVRSSAIGRSVLLFAEDERNDAALVRAREQGGYGFDGVWADDFHHHIRRAVAGDDEGYYCSYSGTARDIAETLRRGWFFTGQHCAHFHAPRGTDPSGIPLRRFVTCLQNHDQVGNRALGDRVHHQIDLATYRAISALLLLAPETPLLFMGQEWAASTPFLFFTDHEPALGDAITEGRRAEFAAFSTFTDPAIRDRIPDPQDPATFRASQLAWDERDHAPHRGTLCLYRALLGLRRSIVSRFESPVLDIRDLDEATIMIGRTAPADSSSTLVVARIGGAGRVDLSSNVPRTNRNWGVLMTTEDPPFAEDGRAPVVEQDGGLTIAFPGAGAVVLSSR